MKTKHKPIDGKYLNIHGEVVVCYGNQNSVLIWREKKPTFKSACTPKMGCVLYRKDIYYLTDFK